MNKLLIALLSLAVFTTAYADEDERECNDCFQLKNRVELSSFSGYDGQPKDVTGSRKEGEFGKLFATDRVNVFATYLGQESGDNNSFSLNGNQLFESNSIGDTVQATFDAGLINFGFTDSTRGDSVFNGYTHQNGERIGFLFMNGEDIKKKYQYLGEFDYVVGFNDSGSSDADYDDFVVGLKVVCAPVPEPESYALMLIGLGLIGLTARRRMS